VTTTRVSRKETDHHGNLGESTSVHQQNLAGVRDDSAGRRKYDERRQVLRNFENGLAQRRRINSSKTSSSVDSDPMDRDDRVMQQRNNNTNKKIATQSHYGQQRTG
jgi:hypothetical protein